MCDVMGGQGVRAIEKYAQSEREEFETYYERLYGMLSRRGRRTAPRTCGRRRRRRNPSRRPASATTANDDDEGRGAMEAPNETVETKTGIETNTEAPMVT